LRCHFVMVLEVTEKKSEIGRLINLLIVVVCSSHSKGLNLMMQDYINNEVSEMTRIKKGSDFGQRFSRKKTANAEPFSADGETNSTCGQALLTCG
jgi:hypothetical protein